MIIWKYESISIWIKNNWKKLLSAILIGGIVTGGLILSEPPIPPTEDIDCAAYIWHQGNGIGSFSYWEVNKTYAKDFLKDNIKWRLKASPDNNTWYDADELLDIDLDWNDTGFYYKITLTLDTHEAPQSLYYRFDLALNKSLKDYVEVDGYEWRFKVPANNTRDYSILINWSDIKPLISNNKVWFDRGVKNNFFWFRIQTVNKIPVDTIFIVDPAIGMITDSAIDTWEIDPQELQYGGRYATVNLGDSEYYATVKSGDTGTDNDGFIRTFKIYDNNGTIHKTLIDSWEYETSSAYTPTITHVSGTTYFITYRTGQTATDGKVATVTISDAGVITKSLLDTDTTTNPLHNPCTILANDGLIVTTYADYGSQYDFQIDTFTVTAAGAITGVVDNEEFLSSPDDLASGISCVMVDDDTLLIVHCGENSVLSPWNLYALTYNISSDGSIDDDPSDSWDFGSKAFSAAVHEVGDNVFLIGYTTDDGDDGWLSTLEVDDDGKITDDLIDSYEFYATASVIYGKGIFTISDASSGVYGISYSDGTGDGFVSTINVTSAGEIDDELIDTMEFDEADFKSTTDKFINVDDNYYMICYTGTGSDGFVKTIEIESPTFSIISNEGPSSGSFNASISPTCNVTVEDIKGRTMDVSFYTSSDNVSFTHQQTNTSVNNGSYEFVYSGATLYQTTYYWKVTAENSDGFNISSDGYEFETTPYRSLYFNDTFPNENWIDSSHNMTFEAGWENFTYSSSSSGNLHYSVGAGVNDAHEGDGGAGYSRTLTYCLCYADSSAGSRYNGGFVFTGVEVPQGATIDSAAMYFEPYNHDSYDDPNVDIYAEDEDSANNFDDEEDVTSRTRTTASVSWVDSNIRGSFVYTPDIKSPIQEVINRGGWSSGNNLCILVDGKSTESPDLIIYSYELGATHDAELFVNYTLSSIKDNGWIMSEPIFKQGDNWDKFYADANDTSSCSFALVDPDDKDYNITSGLVGNGDDISSVTNASVCIYGNFSDASVTLRSWNITWADTPEETTYSKGIRTDGEDFFVWLGGNTTMSGVAENFTGYTFDGDDEISHLDDDGSWVDYTSADEEGEDDIDIYTFDVIKTNLEDDTGELTFEMTENSDYTDHYEDRTFQLIEVGIGYNYTGFSNGDGGTLGAEADAMSMASGYFIAVWDNSTYKWIFHIQGTSINTNQAIEIWDVCVTKISEDRTWDQS